MSNGYLWAMHEMSPSDFKVFLATTKNEEATQRSQSLNVPRAQIEANLDQQLQRMLPDGIKTQDNFFRKLVDKNGQMTGYLWYGLRKNIVNKHRLFIFDIHIFAPYRGKGGGKFMLNWLEAEAKKMGLSEIGLHVLGENKTARNLYEAVGFQITNLDMAKRF